MAVFRVERTGDYTVMSNFHLKDKRLSLKAKGLLSQMLSLPDDWDYTLSGLSYINRESKDAIRSAVNELETAGYIRRRQTTDASGKFAANEYTIFERPIEGEPMLDKPSSENPITVNPSAVNPLPENPTQLNTKKSNTQKQNTHGSNTDSIPFRNACGRSGSAFFTRGAGEKTFCTTFCREKLSTAAAPCVKGCLEQPAGCDKHEINHKLPMNMVRAKRRPF